MFKIKLVLLSTIAINYSVMAAIPASQSWVKENFVPLTSSVINWDSLCPAGQSLTSMNGCAPNCNSGASSAVCNKLFSVGQVEQITGVPLPYLNNGVVVFKLTQTGGGTGASLNIHLMPSEDGYGYGYACEFMNANGTPANLWDTTTPTSMNIVMMSASVSPGITIDSDNFVSNVIQPITSNYKWYSNPNNPLYLFCVAYHVNGVNLQSSVACGGANDACINYTFA